VPFARLSRPSPAAPPPVPSAPASPSPLGSPLGRLLDHDVPAPAPPADRDVVRQWRERAERAAANGDRWLSCALLSPRPDEGPVPAGPAVGEVLTAVESAGWSLAQLDHVVVTSAPAGGPVVRSMCLFRRTGQPTGLGWPTHR
jgi:hypothetical protein